jgi:hypothetical protein
MSHIFLGIQKQLADIKKDDKKVLRLVDHDLGQLDEEVPALSYPCALLDLSRFKFSASGENCQIGEGVIGISLVFAPYSGTNNLAPETVRQKGLEYYEIEQMVQDALEGWNPTFIMQVAGSDPVEEVDVLIDSCGPLTRTAAGTDKRRTDLRIRRVEYELSCEDYTTADTSRTFIPRPDPDTELEGEV